MALIPALGTSRTLGPDCRSWRTGVRRAPVPVYTGGGMTSFAARDERGVLLGRGGRVELRRLPDRTRASAPTGIALVLPRSPAGAADHGSDRHGQRSVAFIATGHANAMLVAAICRQLGRRAAITVGVLYACWCFGDLRESVPSASNRWAHGAGWSPTAAYESPTGQAAPGQNRGRRRPRSPRAVTVKICTCAVAALVVLMLVRGCGVRNRRDWPAPASLCPRRAGAFLRPCAAGAMVRRWSSTIWATHQWTVAN